ncbi:MAG TPA: amidase [Acidimicrobiales bacterium]|nr:amidase [Acidimicrobiales bacterium]
MTDPCLLDAVTLAGLLRRREISSRELVAAHIARIETYDGVINAIVTRDFERAMERAAAADQALAGGGAPLGLLHGLPVAHKDLVDTAGVRTTYGSPIFADNVPERDALVVERMARAGAISLGKTNVPEFGAGSHTVNPVFGATHNPWDPSRSAGGSSGGAAAALAARFVTLADGSDLGGSLRNPANFCNVVGMRPSPGRVPVWPAADVADQMAVSGPMGRTVADTALLLAVLSGPDPRVLLALDQAPPALADPAGLPAFLDGRLDRDLSGVRIAWSPDLGVPVEPAVLDALAPARRILAALGASVSDAAPDLTGADEVFRTLRAFSFASFRGDIYRDHRDRLGPNMTWNIERGFELTRSDLTRASFLRTAVAERVTEFLDQFDVLACPVSQVVPFDVTLDWVHEIDGRPLSTYLDWMASCYLISVTGLPAISVPAGFTAHGLPVGIQLVGRRRGDWDLLAVARAFESATGHAARLPPTVC